MATIHPPAAFPGRGTECALAVFGLLFAVAVALISLDMLSDGAVSGAFRGLDTADCAPCGEKSRDDRA